MPTDPSPTTTNFTAICYSAIHLYYDYQIQLYKISITSPEHKKYQQNIIHSFFCLFGTERGGKGGGAGERLVEV